MRPPISIEEEKRLFEEAIVVISEAALLGKDPMAPPPRHADRCWVHSLDAITNVVLREYWVRLQCYALEGKPSNEVRLWTLFAKVREGEEHPLIHLWERLTKERDLWQSRTY
jgi:hypothetical protein